MKELFLPTIKPGDVFFDKLSDGRYEKCVLQETTVDTLNRHAAARGGTGEFYKVIDSSSKEEIEDTDEVILDVSNDDFGFPKFLVLRKIQ